jgi:WD40 repeat protein
VRLTRRGIALSATGLGGWLAENSLAAPVPASLSAPTLAAASWLARGNPLTGTSIPAGVASMVKGTLRDMTLQRLKWIAVFALSLAILGAGSGVLWQRASAEMGVAKAGPEPGGKRAAPAAFVEPLPEGATARLGSARFRFERDRIARIAYSPDGGLLAAAGQNDVLETVVAIWDAHTGQRLHLLQRSSARGGNNPDQITGLALSADRKTLALATIGWPTVNVILYDWTSGKELHVLPGCSAPVAFSPDGTILATHVPTTEDLARGLWSDRRGPVKLWDPRSGKSLHTLEDSTDPIAFSPDGKRLATGTAGGTAVQVWDPQTGKPLRASIREGGMVQLFPDAFVFSSDNRTLALSLLRIPKGGLPSNLEGVTQLWNTHSGEKLREAPFNMDIDEGWLIPASGRAPDHPFLLFSPNGKTLFAGMRFAHALEVATLQERFKVAGGFGRHFILSPDGRTLASWQGRTIRRWDALTGEPERVPELGHEESVWQLAFRPDGAVLATASGDDRSVRLWDPMRGKELRRIAPTAARGVESSFNRFEFALEGKAVAIAGHGVRFWDTTTGQELRPPAPEVLPTLPWVTLDQFALAPDGKTMACAAEGVTRVTDVATGQEVTRFDGGARGLVFSPDSKLLAQVKEDGPYGSFQCRIYVWDVASGARRCTLGPVHCPCLHFLADGRLAVDDSDGARIYDLTNGKELLRLAAKRRVVATAPDSKLILTWDYATRILFMQEASTGKELYRMPDGGRMTANTHHNVVFSRDGRAIAVGNRDGSIDLREAATGRVVTTLTGHQSRINALAFSPDGGLLATGSNDTTVLVWNVKGLLK